MRNSQINKTRETEFPVRYAETDAMGVVHHANYLVYFEEGRSQYMRDLGSDYALIEASGIDSPSLRPSCATSAAAAMANESASAPVLAKTEAANLRSIIRSSLQNPAIFW